MSKKQEKLQYFHDTAVGLWCIDKNPNDVDIEWIRKNAFQLEPMNKYRAVPKKEKQSVINIGKLVDSIHITLVPMSPDSEQLLNGNAKAIALEIEENVLDALLKGLIHLDKITKRVGDQK